MPHPPKLRIALIGLGDIAQKAYLPILGNHPGVTPLLCTRDPAVLHRLARQYRVDEAFNDLEEVIARRPDAAMVHSSTDSHAALVTRLLEAGIPVFVDKPLSDVPGDTERMLDLAASRQLPLFVGFNRRYAPLVAQLKAAPDPLQVSWRKHRVDLPGEPRTFLFDDFIHVVDGLRFLATGPVENLRVHARMRDGLLTAVDVQWTQGDTLLSGSMNRVSGLTEETIDYFTEGNKWTVKELHAGTHYNNGERTDLGFGNWTPTLEKRGFVAMIEHWLEVVRTGGHDPAYIADMRETHALCERIMKAVTPV